MFARASIRNLIELQGELYDSMTSLPDMPGTLDLINAIDREIERREVEDELDRLAEQDLVEQIDSSKSYDPQQPKVRL